MNPLISPNITDLDYQIPFKDLKPKHFLPAANHYLKMAKSRLELIKNQKNPNFKNVVESLERCDLEFCRVMSIFGNLNSLHKVPSIERISEKIDAISRTWNNLWFYDPKIFIQVKKVYNNSKHLNSVQKKLVTDLYETLVKNGVHLGKVLKTELKNIDKKLGRLELEFGNRLVKNVKYAKVWATDAEIHGIPALDLVRARKAAKKKNKKGYLFDEYDFDSVLEFATSRELRERSHRCWMSSCHSRKKTSTEPLIKKIMVLRQRKAKILGYKNFAELVLTDCMAKNVKSVSSMMEQVDAPIRKKAVKDLKELSELAKKTDNISDFQNWDEHYYRAIAIKKKLKINLVELKDYFPLSTVWAGLQKLIKNMYGVSFDPVKTESYHSSVRNHVVQDVNGKKLGTLFLDLYNRPTKEQGAWMGTFVDPGFKQVPSVVVACNFNKTKHDLLTWEEVLTIFHEMGHALHVFLSKAYFPSQAGHNVAWDFVELPSQFMENWAMEPEILGWISSHYKTGKKLPKRLVTQIPVMNNFMNSFTFLKQIFNTKLDLAFHTTTEPIENVIEFEKTIYEATLLYPFIPTLSRSTSFSHIFDGGYSALYYSYLWANILDRDAFGACKKTGLLKSKLLIKFRELLESGSSLDEALLYKKFKGRVPSVLQFLKSFGF